MITEIKKFDYSDLASSRNFSNLFLNLRNHKISYFYTSKGFTLMELMLAAMILAFVLVGLLGTYITCLDLVETSKNTSIALNNCQVKLEEIKNATYAQIKTNYNKVAFETTGIVGKGVTYAQYCNSPSDCADGYAQTNLLEIIASVSFKQKNGRVIGEDKNLNGIINSGEDTSPANGILDSTAEVITFIAQP